MALAVTADARPLPDLPNEKIDSTQLHLMPSQVWRDGSGNLHSKSALKLVLDEHRLYIRTLKNIIAAHVSDSDRAEDTLEWTLRQAVFPWGFDSSSTLQLELLQAIVSKPYYGSPYIVIDSLASFVKCDFTMFAFDSLDLSNVSFNECKFDYAWFTGSTLYSTRFYQNSTFLNAKMDSIDMRKSVFIDCDLRGSTFGNSDFSRAYIENTNLNRTDFEHADLYRLVYQPSNDPHWRNIIFAYNLDYLDYASDPTPLIRLRQKFRDIGFRSVERQINCSLKRHYPSWYESALFDFTCNYGADYIRPLILWAQLFGIYVLIYFIVLLIPTKQPHVFVIKKHANNIENNSTIRGELSPFVSSNHSGIWSRILSVTKFFLKAMGISLLSSTSIGFRDLTIAQWVRRLLPWDIELRFEGIPRVLSGVHSLLSMYLVALSFLSYFTRVFEFGN